MINDLIKKQSKLFTEQKEDLIIEGLRRKGLIIEDKNDIQELEKKLKGRVQILSSINQPDIFHYALDGKLFLVLDETPNPISPMSIDLSCSLGISIKYKYID
jgi:hypothetical protein